MARYTISGWNGTGWDRSDEATSEREARKVAATMRGSYDPRDTSARVQIDRYGVPVAKWSGSESGRWVRVTP